MAGTTQNSQYARGCCCCCCCCEQQGLLDKRASPSPGDAAEAHDASSYRRGMTLISFPGTPAHFPGCGCAARPWRQLPPGQEPVPCNPAERAAVPRPFWVLPAGPLPLVKPKCFVAFCFPGGDPRGGFFDVSLPPSQDGGRSCLPEDGLTTRTGTWPWTQWPGGTAPSATGKCESPREALVLRPVGHQRHLNLALLKDSVWGGSPIYCSLCARH